MRKSILALSLVSLLVPTQVIAQSVPCGDRTKIIERLKNVYSEELTSMGLSSNGNITEIYSSEEGNYTILSTTPKGLTCLVESGEYYSRIEPEDEEERL